MRTLALVALVTLAPACRLGKGSPDGGSDAAAPFDAATLPETVVIVLEAGVEPDGRGNGTGRSRTVTIMSGLPRPCEDRLLGTVTFAQAHESVVITSTKTKARARCTRLDEHKLLCDWFGMDGKPSVQQKIVTYGSKTKILGSFDAKHTFSCPVQP